MYCVVYLCTIVLNGLGLELMLIVMATIRVDNDVGVNDLSCLTASWWLR